MSENEEIELVFEIPSNTETDGDKPGEFVCNRNLETFDKTLEKYQERNLEKKIKRVKPLVKKGKKIAKKTDSCLMMVMRIIKHIHHIYHSAKLLHLSHQFVKWIY